MKSNYKKPYLEPYKGRASRHECPNCHDEKSFTYYINGSTGRPINNKVGRCNHESSCGYHYTPRKFFNDNPALRDSTDKMGGNFIVHSQETPKPISYIPKRVMLDSIGTDSNFVIFLKKILRYDIVHRLVNDYYLGFTASKEIIYWQADYNGLIRTGKIMQYDPSTGKRVKDKANAINWVHPKLKKDGTLPEDFNLQQCLFGEHLLRKYPRKVVALVESEKSAIVGSGAFPGYI